MVYHLTNKSIAGFRIFNTSYDYERMLLTLYYYLHIFQSRPPISQLLKTAKRKNINYISYIKQNISNIKKDLDLIAFCLMPTHIHLLINAAHDAEISKYMNCILNSYSHYFNLKYKRKGHLWHARTKKILIESDELLLHETMYIHTNPVTAKLVNNAEDWPYSSYREYVKLPSKYTGFCNYKSLLAINIHSYRNFIEINIGSQRELAKAKKHLTLPSGVGWARWIFEKS